MSDYQIVVSDLDGTLLNDQGCLSEENRQAIGALAARGVQVVPCTGRTLMEIDAEIRENPDIRYYIHSDGAGIYDKKTGESVGACMSGEASRLLFDTLEKYPNVMAVRHDRYVYQNLDHVTDEFCAQFELDPFYLYTPAINATFIDRFGETCRKMEGVEMVSAYFRSIRERELLLAELDATGQFGYARHSERPYCEIFAKNAGKGNGVKGLMTWLNCERERVICVGDGVNDLPMVRAAGLGLAVSNACPQLLAEADAVICSNEEHIMRYILEHYVLNA